MQTNDSRPRLPAQIGQVLFCQGCEKIHRACLDIIDICETADLPPSVGDSTVVAALVYVLGHAMKVFPNNHEDIIAQLRQAAGKE